MRLKNKLGFAVIAIMLAIFVQSALALPDGAGVQSGMPVTKGFFASGVTTLQGGNMSNLSIETETQTIAWQGFFGNVSGNITLENSAGDLFYRWNNTKLGEVYASTESSIDFTSITAQNDCTIDEDLTGANSDRVNETFVESANSELFVGPIQIAASTACATNTYINSTTQSSSFEEVILTDDGGTTSIYTTFIENSLLGFDNGAHDFQLIVPDNVNESTTTYFFYVEFD